jgi:predicted Fe-Mo cluster-binding NifX family protein
METTAITFWNGLVSPFFDVAGTILIVKEDGSRRLVDIGCGTVPVKAALAAKHGVAVMICGAISADARAALQMRGIRVVPWVRGQVDEVLKAFANGNLDSDCFLMPGCRRNRCGRRRAAGIKAGRRTCRRPAG